MRKIKRSRAFEIVLNVTDDDFINPPKEAQRNAVINRALKEFVGNLNILNEQTKHFVPGETVHATKKDRSQITLEAQEIMEDWQIPLMKEMAKTIAEDGGDILEIGFGRGISAEMIMAYPIASYTTIECNNTVVDTYYKPFEAKHSNKNVKLYHGLWQDHIDYVGKYDGILFHTYPLNDDEYMQYVNGSITFAEHFFEHASNHLKPGGAFTYFSNEINSLSREHQQLLLKHFSSFSIQALPLSIPDDVKDTWWANSIAVIKAVK
ncbi:class I SAM-dependent methyltransferase [Hyunsoonleella flava]|uniref:Class I SAM-dependent methyltransferase n=1 Tax=Hyunsoonleella flava TaxID=2527939 RepID=A0A4Q9FEJ8_9FLAO|nr:class I SAM-dependent methyltransferase [Hyunsoonleella flava]TBN04428.1 class I SAM-dependent methyltransferase [Hyunsoonleella flava]